MFKRFRSNNATIILTSWYTETPTCLIKSFDVPASVNYKL